MEQTVRVILNYETRELDRPFDYLLPEGMTVQIGDCLCVPFGSRNKIYEAYAVGFGNAENTKHTLKYVLGKAMRGRAFDERGLELICWMRERYLCTWLEAVRAMVPAGTAVKSREYLSRGTVMPEKLSESEARLLEVLDELGGCAESAKLYEAAGGKNAAKTAAKLSHKGVLVFTYEEYTAVKDKQIRGTALAVPVEEARKQVQQLKKRASAQARALELLADTERLGLKDLCSFAGCSPETVRSLEKKGLAKKCMLTTERRAVNRYTRSEAVHELMPQQRAAADRILSAADEERTEQFLLYGVTGSGKTEVFMTVIEEVIRRGKQAIVMVPEISLTPQTLNRFTRRFGNRVAVFHSGLSAGERYDQWKRIRAGRADIVIGARSAVFAPLQNLGVIIMDEEHSDTYKSETAPRYLTREVAEVRCAQYHAPLICASATPSVGSFLRCEQGEMTLLEMPERANGQKMPPIHIADMRLELERGNKSMFSSLLRREIEENLKRGEQTILLMNRRGFFTFVSCRQCGYVAQCPNCNISMTYHKTDDTLRCHYCGHTRPNYTVCPSCQSTYIRYFGGGTQRVEEEVHRLFPSASTLRMDVDTTGGKEAHQKLLDRFENERIDILIGTQMVAKGLDFENVTLVGVVSADTMLHLDDYRSGERTFDLLEQVTGRAGRGGKAGRAVIQTYTPEHSAVVQVQAHDYDAFYRGEREMRRVMWYPPFCELTAVLFSGPEKSEVQDCARLFARRLEPIKKSGEKVQLLGPIPSGISKIKNKYRWQLLIKCENTQRFHPLLHELRALCRQRYERVSVVIDRDPNMI